jgi:formylglycine-generating enzyme required for sulfatase activity
MNATKIIRLIIGIFTISFIMDSFVQAAEKNTIPGKQISIAQVKGEKAGPPGGKGAPPGGKGGPPGGKKGGPPGLRPAEDRKQIYNRKKVLLRLDVNGDESISVQEYNGPLKMFKELDTDGDRKLTFEEAKWMMTFSPIPSGSFMMGSETGNGDARPVHKVSLDFFQISTTEVTTAQFCQYLNSALRDGEITVRLSNAGGMGVRIFIPIPAYEVFGAPGTKYAGKSYILLSPVAGLSHIKLPQHPINIPEHPLNQSWIEYVPDMKRFYVRPGFEDWPAANVRWYGAYAFAEHYGLSLPTEAEWEYVASGGKQFKWGTNDGKISCKNANYACFARGPSAGRTDIVNTPNEWVSYRMKVGSYPSNPYGVFDLAGNVWEWCLDWYKEDFYQYCVDNKITKNPASLLGEEPPPNARGGPAGGWTHDARVTRGGSYQYHEATLATAYRNRNYPSRGNDHWGSRVVLRPSSVVFNVK